MKKCLKGSQISWPPPSAASTPSTASDGALTASKCSACVRGMPQQSRLCGRPPGWGTGSLLMLTVLENSPIFVKHVFVQ